MSAQSAKYNPLISKIFISRGIILKILKEHRKYDTTNYEDASIHELQAMFKNKQMDMLLVNAKITIQDMMKVEAEAKAEAEAKVEAVVQYTLEMNALAYTKARTKLLAAVDVDDKAYKLVHRLDKELEFAHSVMSVLPEGSDERRLPELEYNAKVVESKEAHKKLVISNKIVKVNEKRMAVAIKNKQEFINRADISPEIVETDEKTDTEIEDNIKAKQETNIVKKIYIKYHLEGKLKQTNIYEYIDDIFDVEQILSPTDELLIITKDKVNQITKDLLVNIYNNDKKNVNIYNLNDFLFNIMEHDMVPPHRILSDDEKKDIYTKYYITDDKQLPEISRFDPVALAIGLRSGDLVEITRSSPTAITTNYYRLCI